MNQPSVCIVGAGAIGLASAVALSDRGVTNVKILERQHPAAGSTGLSVGVIETQYLDPLDVELRVVSMRRFSKLEIENGLEIKRIGYLRLGHDDASRELFRSSVEIQGALGVDDACVLEPSSIAKLVPDLDLSDITSGLYGSSDGVIDGYQYCSILSEMAIDAGVDLLQRTALLASTPIKAGGHLLHTTAGDIVCDVVVNAAGPWSGDVARALGVEMPLCPQRHQAVVVELSRRLPYTMPMVMDYAPRSGDVGLYFRQEGKQQLIAGLHSEEVINDVDDPNTFRRDVDEDFVEKVASKLASRLPRLADSGFSGGWAGLYPVSPDGRPIVGPAVGSDSVVLAGGAGGSGIQISPAVGELVADWITGGTGKTISGADALSPRRESLYRAGVVHD